MCTEKYRNCSIISKSEKYTEKTLTVTSQLYGFSNDQIFSARHSPKQESKVNVVQQKPLSPLSLPEHDQPHCTNIQTCPQLQMCPQALGGLQGREGLLQPANVSQELSTLSQALTHIHTCKTATVGETVFVLARVITTGWLGWLEPPGKDRSVLKSPASAGDCISQGELPAALVKRGMSPVLRS